jgi:hypothetical protein
MKRILLLAAALAAVGPSYAKKPKPPETPPAPVTSYEMDDAAMGDALDQVCIAEPLAAETYDSKNNMVIIAAADGGKAFLHLKGDCDTMTLLFATSATGGNNGCYKSGDDITFVSESGAKTCEIASVNAWTPAPEEPYEDDGGAQY